MSFVLTETSTLVCTHQGSVTVVAGQSKLTVSGAKVLVDGDLNGASIKGCVTVPAPPPPGPTSKLCLTVSSAAGGVSTKLTVNGKGVLLDTIQGTTDGMVANVVPQQWSVQAAGETKLKAI